MASAGGGGLQLDLAVDRVDNINVASSNPVQQLLCEHSSIGKERLDY